MRILITHDFSTGPELGPDSPPTIAQSILLKLIFPRSASNGSNDANRTFAGIARRWSSLNRYSVVSTLTTTQAFAGPEGMQITTSISHASNSEWSHQTILAAVAKYFFIPNQYCVPESSRVPAQARRFCRTLLSYGASFPREFAPQDFGSA